MANQDKTKAELKKEVAALHTRVAQLERSEESLHEAESRYQRLWGMLPLGVVECDVDGAITAVNRAYEQMHGYGENELVGTHIRDMMAPGPIREDLSARLKRVAAEQPLPTPYQGCDVTRDGRILDVQVDWTYKRDRKGQVTGFVSVVADVTQRKQAEDDLAKYTAMLRATIDCLPFDFYALGPDGRYVLQNVASRQHWGDAIGKRLEDVADDEDGSRHWLDNAQRAMAGERVEEEANLRIGGEERAIHSILTPIRDGANFHGVLGVDLDITEQERAKEALRRVNEQLEQNVKQRTEQLAIFRLFVEASSQGFGMTDLDGKVTYLNPALCRMAGVEDAKEAVGRHLTELYHEGYDQRWVEEILPALQRDGKWGGEVPGSIDGRPAYALQHRFLMRDEQGNPAGMAVVMTNITRRKQAEDALRASEERLRLALDAMSDGYWERDIQHDRLYFAPRYQQLLGYAPEEMPKTDDEWQHLVHPDDNRIAAEKIRDHLEGRAPAFEVEFRARKKSGGWLWMLGRGKIVRRDSEGQPAAMVGVNIDISERKIAEEALRTSEERFRSYFEQGLIGMAVSTPQMQWMEVNDRFCEILGYSREELLRMRWTDVTHPDDSEAGLAHYRRMATGEIDHYTAEKRLLRKDGRTVHTNIFARSFRGKDGSVDHFLALIEDITDRKKAQETLRREYQTLEHLLESSDHERQLIAYELHDGLAQYLAGCIMQFQTYEHLRNRKPEDAAKAFDGALTLLRQAHYESRRLIAGVRPPVLDESGVVEAIAHLVHEVGQSYDSTIEFRSSVHFGRLAPTLENAIYRIAQEALSNACRHSNSEQIEVSLVQRDDRVRIVVQDWGTGFDTADVPSGRFGLEGIRQRARLLGGRWSIRSTPGQGSRISVEVPLLARGLGNEDSSGHDGSALT